MPTTSSYRVVRFSRERSFLGDRLSVWVTVNDRHFEYRFHWDDVLAANAGYFGKMRFEIMLRRVVPPEFIDMVLGAWHDFQRIE